MPRPHTTIELRHCAGPGAKRGYETKEGYAPGMAARLGEEIKVIQREATASFFLVSRGLHRLPINPPFRSFYPEFPEEPFCKKTRRRFLPCRDATGRARF